MNLIESLGKLQHDVDGVVVRLEHEGGLCSFQSQKPAGEVLEGATRPPDSLCETGETVKSEFVKTALAFKNSRRKKVANCVLDVRVSISSRLLLAVANIKKSEQRLAR